MRGAASPIRRRIAAADAVRCTSAARKLERKLLQVFGVRSYLAGRTALMRGRMNRSDAGVILGSTPVISLIRSTADLRSRRRFGVSEGSSSCRAITSARVGIVAIEFISALIMVYGRYGWTSLVSIGHSGNLCKSTWRQFSY